MKRHTITNAKNMHQDTILDILYKAGFSVRSPIGYNWTKDPQGKDCEFTQPPEYHTEGCKYQPQTNSSSS